MGSKRALLLNGLGAVLTEEAQRSSRFLDLFSGTARVSWHVAEATSVPVVAGDLQTFSSVLASAVVERTRPVDLQAIDAAWLTPARRALAHDSSYRYAITVEGERVTAALVKDARRLCAEADGGPIWGAYGGHYYSPTQAATLDVLLATLPTNPTLRRVSHAALIFAASRCAAAPGHTAQPFQPTSTAAPYIEAAWAKRPIDICAAFSQSLAPRHARTKGRATTGDANVLARKARKGDLVFLDPPYSAVQYSRFYHVLETIARGGCGQVEGVGRYPPASERPTSDYSIKTRALARMTELLLTLHNRECRVIITFPQGRASNGIEGEELIELVRPMFAVDARVLASHFSTLGGNNGHRAARRRSTELIIRLSPR